MVDSLYYLKLINMLNNTSNNNLIQGNYKKYLENICDFII